LYACSSGVLPLWSSMSFVMPASINTCSTTHNRGERVEQVDSLCLTSIAVALWIHTHK
jgi:hypothetical protein